MALNTGIEIRLYRADQKWKLGRWQAAWNEMSRHPAIACERPEATKLWMHICIALRKWSLGEKFGELLVEQDPSEEMNWLYYGMCAQHSRGSKGYFEVYSKAAGLFPSSGAYHYRLAKALCGLGRVEEARESLTLALALDPSCRKYAMDEPLFSDIWETCAAVEG